jgi:hypothetical protein
LNEDLNNWRRYLLYSRSNAFFWKLCFIKTQLRYFSTYLFIFRIGIN